jgi:hypothetical protein
MCFVSLASDKGEAGAGGTVFSSLTLLRVRSLILALMIGAFYDSVFTIVDTMLALRYNPHRESFTGIL